MRLKQIKSNFSLVSMGHITIWFSYETPIAFSSYGQIFIHKNDWGPTTGKHLNHINPDKNIRMDGDKFEKLLRHNMGLVFAPVSRAS